LIINALGAIEGQKGIITIMTRYEDREFRVAFSDNGKGIAPEHQEHIFEPFFTTHHRGTGLGLYIARELCEANEARLELMGRGKGADFRLLGRALDC